MEVKSGRHHALGPRPGAARKGFYNISGTGLVGARGKVRQVDVSVDGRANWRTASAGDAGVVQVPDAFHLDWVWDGQPALIQSRATDDRASAGSYRQLRRRRGSRSIYHNKRHPDLAGEPTAR